MVNFTVGFGALVVGFFVADACVGLGIEKGADGCS